jgi:hypothetical protein
VLKKIAPECPYKRFSLCAYSFLSTHFELVFRQIDFQNPRLLSSIEEGERIPEHAERRNPLAHPLHPGQPGGIVPTLVHQLQAHLDQVVTSRFCGIRNSSLLFIG